MDSKRELIGFLSEYLEMGEEELTPEMDLIEDLNLDPSEAVDLVHQAAERLGIEVPDEEIAKVRTVQDLLNLTETYA